MADPICTTCHDALGLRCYHGNRRPVSCSACLHRGEGYLCAAAFDAVASRPPPADLVEVVEVVIPSLDESARPLGVTAGYHTGPGPHFPHHDVRRMYAKRPPRRRPTADRPYQGKESS